MKTKSRDGLKRGLVWVGLSLFAFIGGCSNSAFSGRKNLEGPSQLVQVTSQPWHENGYDGLVLSTPHYQIYTTISRDDAWQTLAQTLEGAYVEYQKIVPGVKPSDKPMPCYVFGNYQQWRRFTIGRTGADSKVYLQVMNGGYAFEDMFVAYYMNDAATRSVAAHEGWHQFVSRNFKGRIPPFLEEGIATMFEDLEFEGDLPRWNLSVNRSRLQHLRQAVEGNYLYPLQTIVGLHAGNVIDQSGTRIMTFYAESWGFATFLWNGQDQKYRPALQKMLADIANGTVYDPTGAFQNRNRPWVAAGVQPILEHYLGQPLSQIDVEFKQYIQKVAFDQYSQQFD